MSQASSKKKERDLTVWEFQQQLNPTRAIERLRSMDIDEIADEFKMFRTAESMSWIGMACCVGVAQEISDHGDSTLDTLAAKFGYAKSRVAKFGQVYREILLPRLEKSPDADLPVQESTFYVQAVEMAPKVKKTPLELIEWLEDKKAEEPGFSTRDFAAEFAPVETSSKEKADPQDKTRLKTAEIQSALRALEGVRDDDVRNWAKSCNGETWEPFIEELAPVLKALAETLPVIRKRAEAQRAERDAAKTAAEKEKAKKKEAKAVKTKKVKGEALPFAKPSKKGRTRRAEAPTVEEIETALDENEPTVEEIDFE